MNPSLVCGEGPLEQLLEVCRCQPDDPVSPAEAPGGDPGTAPARSAGAALVQLGGPAKTFGEQEQPALATADDPGWARRLVEETAEAMAASAFAAVENTGCPTCPVRACCPLNPEGRSAAAGAS